MATRGATIKAVVTAETTQAEAGLKRMHMQVQGFGQVTGGVFDGLGLGLSRFAGPAGLGLAIVGAGKLGIEMNQLRQQSQNVERQLTAYAGGAGQAKAATDALVEATDQGVSRMDAQRMAAQLLGMGLAETADQVYELTRMAVLLGDKTLSVEERMGSWNAMLANQSIERLDTFGISSGRVRQRIDELMAANKGLSREQAYVNAVLEIGGEKLDAVEAQGVEAASSVDKVTSAWMNLRTEAAQEINLDGILGGIANKFNQVAYRMSDEGQAGADMRIWAARYTTAMRSVNAAQADLAGWYAQVNPLARANYELKLEEAQATADAALENYRLARSAFNSAQGLSTEGEAADLTRIRLLGLAAAQREVAASKPAGTTTGTFTEPSKTRWGLYTDYARSIAGATTSKQDAARALEDWKRRVGLINDDVAVDAGRSWAREMTDAARDFQGEFKGALDGAIRDSIGLGSLLPGGGADPNAPGANGAFEAIFRLQSVAIHGTGGANEQEWAAMYGLDQAGAAEVVRKFQQGLWDESVKQFINFDQLKEQIQTQQMAGALMDQLAADLAAETQGDPKLIKALLGLGGGGDQAGGGQLTGMDLSGFVPGFLAGVDNALAEDAKELEARGEQLFDKLGGGFVKRATESRVFRQGVEKIVESVLAEGLED